MLNLLKIAEERHREEDKTVEKTTEAEIEQTEQEACTNSAEEDKNESLISSKGNVISDTDEGGLRKRKRDKLDIDSYFEKIGNKGRKKIRCSICYKYPDVVKLHKKSDHVPSICTSSGGEVRKAYMDKHLQSAMRIAACRADRLKGLSHPSLIEDDATIDSQISKANNVLFRRIGGHMFTVLNDAKRGTLKAWSWPSRTFQRKEYFMANGTIQGFEENPNDF